MIRIKEMIQLKPYTAFLYLFLFAGFFNDVIRLGSSQLTLFRVLLPVAFALTVNFSRRLRNLYIIFGLFSIIALLQSFAFCSYNNMGIEFKLSRFLTYLFYYFCIFAVIGAVIALYEKEKENFAKNFETFLVAVGIGYLLMFAVIYHVSSARNYLNINNQNDYGAMLTMLCPVFFYRNRDKKEPINYIFIALVMLYLVLNDCKLALLGLAAQIFIVIYLDLRSRTVVWRPLLLVPAIFTLIVLVLLLNMSDFSAHGYDWNNTIMSPIKAMLKGELYPQSNTSVTYRVNTFIVSTKWMVKTKFMGVGLGNSGLIVRKVLGDKNLYEKWMVNNTVSLHNAFLEFLLELGVVAIAGFIALIRKIVCILRETKMDNAEACFITVSVSGLLWLQGPSGILVDYLIFAAFAFLLLRIMKTDDGGNETI